MSDIFRLCPKNRLLIERQLNGGQWGFYRVCDSPADAKRSLSVIRGDAPQDTEQMDLLSQEYVET